MINSRVKTKDGFEDIVAYTPQEVKLPVIPFKWVNRNRKKTFFATSFCVLDTETSHIDEETAWVYQWAFKLKNTYVYGRTPEELIDLLRKMADVYQLREDKKFILYIHNAAYDVQYLKHYLRKYDPFLKIMSTDAHAVLTASVFGFKILCSYRLTNLSLDILSQNYAHKYRKAVGDVDYTLIHYQDQELTPQDWEYQFSDVASQMDGIQGYLHSMGYEYAYKAPITSTGFVRETCRLAAAEEEGWRDKFQKSRLTLEQYKLCRWAFMGGVCISSYVYSGETVRGDLGHDDFTSSYPARQIMDYAPVGAPSWYGDVDDMEEFNALLEDYCCVFELTLEDVHIKKGITAPCIPASKCIGLQDEVKINGKIVSAKHLTIAITELDYKWIKKQYEAESVKVSHLLIFERGPFPYFLRTEVMDYFKGKCTLKHVDSVLYGKSKALLNAVYGMTATALIRDEYEMDEDLIMNPKKYYGDDVEVERKDELIEEAEEKMLNKYYSSRKSFLPYQLSLYTTAHARDALYTMIETVGYENFLYCDTDSVFYIRTPEVEKRMEAYRAQCIEHARSMGAYVGDNYLGAPTKEAPIRAFRSLHAKCYAVEELNEDTGEYVLKVTIAGIPKKSIKWIGGKPIEKTNAEELQSIDNLEDGFVFEHCGGTRCIYVEREIEEIEIRGHVTSLSSAAIIENISKEISDNMWCEENYYLLNIDEKQE